MKLTSFNVTRIFLTLTLTLAFTSAVSAFVTLTNNQWVITTGSGGSSATLTGTLTTNNLAVNGSVTGTMNANAINASSILVYNTLTSNGTLNANQINANHILTWGTLTSTAQLWAKSDLRVSGSTTLEGSATTYGDLSAYIGIDLGRAAGNNLLAALQMDYYNTPASPKTASFDLIDIDATFRWQDRLISGTPRPKMKLDASNVLTLYNTAGAQAVTITPATGKIDLMGASGAGIYSNNVPVVAVDSGGASNITSSSLTVSGATTVNSLNATGTATLNALTVTGTTILSGQVILATPQGDINMGLYGQ